MNKKTCTKCKVEKDLNDFGKAPANKDGLRGSCKTCDKKYKKKHYQNNKEELKVKHKIYRENNKENKSIYNKQYRQDNSEKVATYQKEYREANINSLKDSKKQYQINNVESIKESKKQYRKNNASKINAYNVNRKAIKLQRTPASADLAAIEKIYKECIRITKETGILHHVDHIIPLQGKDVCGFHVENNLQIITALENLTKGNR